MTTALCYSNKSLQRRLCMLTCQIQSTSQQRTSYNWSKNCWKNLQNMGQLYNSNRLKKSYRLIRPTTCLMGN